MTEAWSSGAVYSCAFEKLVIDGEGDVVGLLAYALFKQSVREAAMAGEVLPAAQRNPTATSIKAHRDAAEKLLKGDAVSALLK